MRATIRAAVAACLLIFCLVVSLTAMAADTGGSPNSRILDDVVAPPAVHNRTAFYVGVLAGADIAQLETATFKFSDTAWLAGGFAGVNYRVPSSPLVIGLEGDYLFTDIKGTPGMVVVATTHYLASVRARAGVAVGPALFYVTGGAAFTENSLAVPGTTDKMTLVGVALGAGIEAEITKALFVRMEAIHYAFPDATASCGPACLYSSKDQQTTVRAAVGFKLN